MKKLYFIFLILVVAFSLQGYAAATIYVNQAATGSNDGTNWANAYTSLQSALDVAVSGDQIWVAKGTYYPSSAYDLTVAGDRDFHFRMIEGVAIYGGFSGIETTIDERTNFGSGETNETILSGNIGTDGDNTDNCYHVFYNPSSLYLTSAAILNGFTITGGYANGTSLHKYGGGMYNSSSSATLTNVTFSLNTASMFGGGMFNSNSYLTLTNVTFSLNTAGGNGGGMYNAGSSPTLTGVIFIWNTANTNGGGMYNRSSYPILTNVTFTSNSATDGGGMYNEISSSPTLNNVTFTLNTADSEGGGIYNYNSSSPTFNNCIVWDNTATTSGNQIYNAGITTLNYSCYSNGTNEIYNDGGTFIPTSCITTDPLFLNAGNNDFRLKLNSPCVDAGNDSYNSEAYDIRGTGFGRKLLKTDAAQSGTIDMGAYEYNKSTDSRIYVNPLATGNYDGSSWKNAFPTLEWALYFAVSGDQIWVAKGTYKPSSAYDLTEDGDRDFHFEMVEGVAIYGGFAGTETSVSERTNFGFGQANETILSGDIGTVGDNTDNCYHVIYNPGTSGLTSAAILNGFTITGGNANCDKEGYNLGYYLHHYGGGMYNASVSPELVNITFRSNLAIKGGAMYNANISYALKLTNVLFASNEATYSGGCMYNSLSSVQLTNTTMVSNTAGDHGGAIWGEHGALVLKNCIVWDNTATTNGNQLYLGAVQTYIYNSCYSNSTNDIYTKYGSFTASNNINTDPKFFDAANNDWRLFDNSPCVDNGDNSYNTTIADIRGQARIQNTTIDMGAYEWTSGLDPVCTSPTDGGEISSDQDICYGTTPNTVTSASLPSGHTGALEYQWQSSTTSATQGFSDIATFNEETYSPGALTTTTWFKRLAKVSCMADWTNALESNVIKITVIDIPSAPTITGGSNTYTYDGTLKTSAANVGAGETIDWYDAATDGNAVSLPTGTNAGIYSAYAEARNTTAGCISTSRTLVTLTIEKAELTVIPNSSQSITYGESDPVLTYSNTPELAAGNAFTGFLSRALGEDAGDYEIVVGTLSAGNNYSISLANEVFTITPKTVTITPDDSQSKVYGESDPVLSYSYTPELVAGNTFTGALSRVSGEDAGDYEIAIGTLSAGNNYSISLADGVFTVSSKTVTVTPDDSQSKVYGESDPVLSYSYTPELTIGNTFSGSLSRASGEDVGSDYTITIGTLSAGNNYLITLADENFVIMAKPITVTADADQNKEYGDIDPEITYTVSPALIGSDAFTGTIARVTGENIGTYAINQGTLAAGTNYNLTFTGADFTITTKSITVTADAKSKVYGDADPILTYTYTPELATGDAFSGELSREAGEDAGTYAITLGTLSIVSNYSITLADENFTIMAKTVYVFSDAALTKEYGNADPELTYTYAPELIDGNAFSGELSRESGEDVDAYLIGIGALSAGSNYEIDFTSTYFVITAKQLTISDPELITTKQYDGHTIADVSSGTLSGALTSDEGKVSVTAIAHYDDASIGSGKLITVNYLLNGSAALNYLAPADYIVYTGIISDQTTITNLQSLHAGCEGGTFEISYSLLNGTPAEYHVLFDKSAISAGFSDISYTVLPSSSDAGIISINVPEGVAYGTYTAQLQLRNTVGAESDLFPFSFTINISSDLLIDKFDDVILCDNSSNQFLSYQWYKDDVLISGATNQFYCDPTGLSGAYYVQVITTHGERLRTCPATYNKVLSKKATLTVYPNPAQTGQTFAVKVIGANEEDLKGAKLSIYNIFGIEVYKSDHVETLNYLNLDAQSNNYVIRIITAKGKELNGKLTILK